MKSKSDLERAYEEVRSEPPCKAVLDWRETCAWRERVAANLDRYLNERPTRCPACSGAGKIYLSRARTEESARKCSACDGKGA